MTSNIPASLANVKTISSGHYFTAALKEDGTVVMWGSNADAPKGIRNVTTIAVGVDHMVALVDNGNVNVLEQQEKMQISKHTGPMLQSGYYLSVPQNAVATLYNINGRILAQWTTGRYKLDQVTTATVNGIYCIKG